MLNKIIQSFACIFLMIISSVSGYNVLSVKKLEQSNLSNIIEYYQESDNYEYKSDYSGYIGILDIPDIKLSRGFYDKTSPLNDVNKNIYYALESVPFEKHNSLIILAAHRGNSKVSYFNDLDKLNLGSLIFLNFKGEKYTYVLNNKYNELKDGHLNIVYDSNKDALILITCNKIKRKYQTIYVAYREENVNDYSNIFNM